MKIWVLFSIANDYDQPENNLVAWWTDKPTFDVLAKTLDITVDKQKGNPDIGRILQGQERRIGNTNYRLREIEEGIINQ